MPIQYVLLLLLSVFLICSSSVVATLQCVKRIQKNQLRKVHLVRTNDRGLYLSCLEKLDENAHKILCMGEKDESTPFYYVVYQDIEQ